MRYFDYIRFPFYLTLSLLLTNCKRGSGGEFVAYFGGEIVNPTNPYVLFYKDDEILDTFKLDKKNRFFVKFDSLAPGLYSFKHEPEYQYVYFDKNDSIMVRVNTKDFDNSVMFCGRGDTKNNFMMELYLKNEKDRNNMFEVFEYPLGKFTNNIDSSYLSMQQFYEKKKQELKWSDEFDQFAKAAVDFPYYPKKEIYPYIHSIRTGNDVYEELTPSYYKFRKGINFNNEAMIGFSPYVMYLSSMLNNMGAINYHNHFSEADLALKTNINKMHIADTLIKNEKLKNILLNNIAFTYLLEDQNMAYNKSFLETYQKISTDKSKKNEILKIGNAIKELKTGNDLPEVTLINAENKKVSSKNICKPNTVIFFWTGRAYSHFEAVHKKILQFKKSHPKYNFVAINLNDTQDEWVKLMRAYKLNTITELRCPDFEDIKYKWAINKIHRTIILDNSGKIKNAFTNIFDTEFEKELQ